MVSVILVLLALGVYWLWRRVSLKATEPPMYPGGWPLVGHAPWIFGDTRKLWAAATELAYKCNDMGGVVATSLGPITVYFITDPDDCLTVANTCLEKDRLYDFAKPWLGNGLLTGKAATWKGHRQLLEQAFSQTVLDGFQGLFNSQARRLVEELSDEAGNGPFEHGPYTSHNSLETICLTALGVDVVNHTLFSSQFVDATEQMLDIMMERFQKFWLHNSYIFHRTNLKKRQDKCLKILHNISDLVLQQKKAKLNKIGSNGKIKSPDTVKVFMDLLLELSVEKGVFTDSQIREHVDTIIVGGHESVASVMMFTMMLLGSHSGVQERALAEIQEVLVNSDCDVEKADLSRLVYLEAVLKESMRVYTIAPVVARWLDRDVKLKNYTLSAGRTCFLFMFGIHRHPVWGPDAHQCRPERWLDPARLPDNANAFGAFSVGRRMCIGKHFAYMSMKTSLVHLLRRYRISANHTELVLKINVMLKPVSGHYISIDRRPETSGV